MQISKLQIEIDKESEHRIELIRNEKIATDKKRKTGLQSKLERSDEKLQSMTVLMLHYCAGLQHCLDQEEIERQKNETICNEVFEDANVQLIHAATTCLTNILAESDLHQPQPYSDEQPGASGNQILSTKVQIDEVIIKMNQPNSDKEVLCNLNCNQNVVSDEHTVTSLMYDDYVTDSMSKCVDNDVNNYVIGNFSDSDALLHAAVDVPTIIEASVEPHIERITIEEHDHDSVTENEPRNGSEAGDDPGHNMVVLTSYDGPTSESVIIDKPSDTLIVSGEPASVSVMGDEAGDGLATEDEPSHGGEVDEAPSKGSVSGDESEDGSVTSTTLKQILHS